MSEHWLSTTEAARRMHLTQREVLEMALADKLTHRVDLDHHVVSAESVDAYLTEQARRELAEDVDPERAREEYEREKADDVNEKQGDDEQ